MNVVGGIFGNFQTLTVSGNVYNDQNGDGLKHRASRDCGLDGRPGGFQRQRPRHGAYRRQRQLHLHGRRPGSYEVAEVVQTNWVQTQPLYPTVYTFTGKSGHNLTALNFGDHASPALSPIAVIDNGQPGYSETGSWSTAVGGFNGTNRVAKTTHGSGSDGHGDLELHRPALRLVRRLRDLRQQEQLLQGGTVQRVRRRHEPGHAATSTSRSW